MDHVLPVDALLQLSAAGNDVSAWRHMHVHTVGRSMYNVHEQSGKIHVYVTEKIYIVSIYVHLSVQYNSSMLSTEDS